MARVLRASLSKRLVMRRKSLMRQEAYDLVPPPVDMLGTIGFLGRVTAARDDR